MRHEGRFNLISYFSAAAFACFLVIAVLSSWIYFRVARENLVRNNETYALSVGATMNDLFLREFVAPKAARGIPIDLEGRPEQAEELDAILHTYTRHFFVPKVKVYGPDGKIVYCTDHSLIGVLNPENEKFRRAMRGEINSFLKLHKSGADTKKEIDTKDLLEVYVPVRNESAEVNGVFEIYLDVTYLYGEIHRTRVRVALFTFGILGILYLVLVGIVYRGHRVIERSKRQLILANRDLAASEGRILRKTETLEILNEIARVSYATDLPLQPFSLCLSRIREFLGFDVAFLCVYNDPGEAPLLLCADPESGLDANAVSELLLAREENPVSSRIWGGRKMVSGDLSSREGGAAWRAGTGLGGLAVYPLGSIPGAAGFFGAGNRVPGEIPADAVETLAAFASQFGLTLRNIKLFRDVNDLSLTDQLTGVANRRGLSMVLEREISVGSRYHRTLTAVMVDLDHFKRVNDTHGHDFGDTVLRKVAEVLRENVRGADFIARYGGEEFCVILPYTDGEMALTISERLRRAVAALLFTPGEGAGFGLTASFGVAVFPRDAGTAEELLRKADSALYLAKARGRNRVECFGGDVATPG